MNCTRANEPPRTSAVVLIVRVLARPGHALDQQVALRQEADEHALEHRVLAGDDPPDLEERLLEPVAEFGRFHNRLPSSLRLSLDCARSSKAWMSD